VSFIIALSFDQQICFKSGRNLEIVLRCSKEQPAICFCFAYFCFVVVVVVVFVSVFFPTEVDTTTPEKNII